MTKPATLKAFFDALRAPTGPHVFNPWREADPGTDADPAPRAVQARVARLKCHLDTPARYLLVGEAAGYQGCHVSGIPFTSERLILEQVIPRVSSDARLSTRARPWSEPSATTVWGTLKALGIAEITVLWNAYPWHPHRPGILQSNRTPTPAERIAGRPVMQRLLAAFPDITVFAVGRTAEASLAEVGVEAIPLRHPSMGGARQFAAQLQAAVSVGASPGR